jgi:hypothetical protein
VPLLFSALKKSFLRFIAPWLLAWLVAGCASSGAVRNASPITAKPFDLDLVWVKTFSSLNDLEPEKRTLNDAIVSGLRETQLFKEVSGDKAELGTGSGITIDADVREIKKISKNERLWAGAMAGKARIRIHVTVCNLNSGNQIETFEAEGESSGGSALAGTTDEAIYRAAGVVVGEVLKINSQTAQ